MALEMSLNGKEAVMWPAPVIQFSNLHVNFEHVLYFFVFLSRRVCVTSMPNCTLLYLLGFNKVQNVDIKKNPLINLYFDSMD